MRFNFYSGRIAEQVISEKLDLTNLNTQENGHSLALCYNVIDSLGGKMDIHSAPTEGTTIGISFPIDTQLSC